MEAFNLLFCLVSFVLFTNHSAFCQVPEDSFAPIEEPAFLVATPSRPVQLAGGRISMTCVAFGAPFPDIVWSSSSQGINDYSIVNDPNINVHTFNLTDPTTGFVLCVSVLELCNADNSASRISDFRCTTVNTLSGSALPRLGENTAVFDISPMVQESSVLLVAPTQNDFQYQGNRLSVTCAAYGSPRPRVWISSESLGVTDFANEENSFINVYTEDIDTGDYTFVQTTLEICVGQNDFETYSRYITGMECNTENGIKVDSANAVGVQIIGFRPQPFSRISYFDLSPDIKRMQLTVGYSASFNPNHFGCSIRTFTFTDHPINPSRTFSPQYPGSCEIRSNSETRFTMDNRDYVRFIDLGFTQDSSSNNVYLYTTEGQSFAPPITLEPITSTNAFRVRNYNYFTSTDVNINLLQFDVYFTSSELLLFLHFDTIIQTPTLDLNQLRLTNGQSSANARQLSAAALNNDGSHVKTACVVVRDEDRLVLMRSRICTNRSNCYLYIPSNGYVRSHTRNTIPNEINSNNARQTRYFWTPPQLGQVYLDIRVQFIGCTMDLSLGVNEPYRILTSVDETVTRVTCNGNSDTHINPKLNFNGQRIDESYLTRVWPSNITFNSPDGVVTGEQLGVYTCTTYENTANISHLIHTGDPSAYLLNGGEFSVEMFERVAVRFTYYKTSSDDFTVRRTDTNAPPFEYMVDTSAPYIAEVIIDGALLSWSGSYDIITDDRTIARFTISVRTPTLEVSPAAVVLLSNETMVTLTCTGSNPSLPVHWTRSDDPTRILSNANTYNVMLSMTEIVRLVGQAYLCRVFDPEGSMDPINGALVATRRIPIRSINDSLSVYSGTSDRSQVMTNDVIVVTNRFSADTYLECFGHMASGVNNLYWTIARVGEEPVVTNDEIDDERYTVTLGDNYITLNIVHSTDPFRGVVRCNSRTVEQEITVFIRQNNFQFVSCPESVDSSWRLTWPRTEVGIEDGQPCPMSNGNPTTGTATRTCMDGGVWSIVDSSACHLSTFTSVEQEFEVFTEDEPFITDEVHRAFRINKVASLLRDLTTAGRDSIFPNDIQFSISFTNRLLSIIRTQQLPTIATVYADVFDQLLNVNNTGGWTYLRQVGDRTSASFVMTAELYSNYLYEALINPAVQSDPGNEISFFRDNIEFVIKNIPTVSSNESFTFGEPESGFVRISLPEELLLSQRTRGLLHIGYKNLNDFLPRDQPDFTNNRTTIIASVLASTQIVSSGTPPLFFPESSPAGLEFVTLRTARVENPRVVYWNPNVGQWSRIDSTAVPIEDGEFKVFSVSAEAQQFVSAFGVAMDVNENAFTFTTPVWVGSGVILLASALGIFALFLTFAVDGVRSFFTVSFITHLSFMFSIMCAFLAFMAGVELAVEHRLGCAATAGLLHYFFTAAFSWLLCEGILLTAFTGVAPHWPLVFVFLLIGWGVPAVPTAISLGLFSDSYGTSTQCWFYFDGDISQPIVLGFLVPKIILFVLIVICAVVGMVTNSLFFVKANRLQLQAYLRNPFLCMLWFLWMSLIIILILLSLDWVFAMLMVNVYGLDSELLGWAFMGVSIALALYIFIFAVVILIVNQKINYENFYAKQGAYVGDAGGTTYDYRNVGMAAGPLDKRRFSGGPMTVPNPTFSDDDPDYELPAK